MLMCVQVCMLMCVQVHMFTCECLWKPEMTSDVILPQSRLILISFLILGFLCVCVVCIGCFACM